jgi:hypothetical protein
MSSTGFTVIIVNSIVTRSYDAYFSFTAKFVPKPVFFEKSPLYLLNYFQKSKTNLYKYIIA